MTWTPTHPDGSPIAQDEVFFAPPPPQIGAVLWAQSTARTRGWRQPRWLRHAASAAFAALWVAFVVREIVNNGGVDDGQPIIFAGGALILGVMRFLLGKHLKYVRTCDYVGDHGAARFACFDTTDNFRAMHVVRFDQLEFHFSRGTDIIRNGFYNRTEFADEWYGPAGELAVHSERGQYNKKRRARPLAFHVLQRTVDAWTNFIAPRLEQRLAQTGELYFPVRWARPLSNIDGIGLGPGYIVFSVQGVLERVAATEVASLTLDRGRFYLTLSPRPDGAKRARKDYRWPYGGMGNVVSFMALTPRLLGVAVNG